MQDRPDLSELVEAVAEFLGVEVAPRVEDPRLRFRALVAANVLRIAVREITAGTAPLERELSGLRALLGGDGAPAAAAAGGDYVRDAVSALNETLCLAIRGGRIDASPSGAVWRHVRATLEDTLQVANPEYVARVVGERSARGG